MARHPRDAGNSLHGSSAIWTSRLPSRQPRLNPPNPFLRPDCEAETAVCGAFIALDFRERTPNLANVGSTAKKILLKRNQSSYSSKDAAERIKDALVAMYQRGALDLTKDLLDLCILHGDSLHPETRAYLGLPHLAPVPQMSAAPSPPPTWQPSFSLANL